MPTSAYYPFDSFVEAICEKVHNLASDTLTIALTNSAPSAANTQLTDITEISYTYCSARVVTVTSSGQTSGTYKLVLQDLVLTATGGDVGPFRYPVLYNDSATNDELIAYFDYGSSITVSNGEQLTLNFDDSNGVLQIAPV